MTQPYTHILLVNCPDESGLIFKVSKIVYEHRLNIVRNGEFVEKEFNRFFMRTEFSGEINEDIFLNEVMSPLLKVSFTNLQKRFFGSKKKIFQRKYFQKTFKSQVHIRK